MDLYVTLFCIFQVSCKCYHTFIIKKNKYQEMEPKTEKKNAQRLDLCIFFKKSSSDLFTVRVENPQVEQHDIGKKIN